MCMEGKKMKKINLILIFCLLVFISDAYSEIINPIGTKLIQPSGGVYRHGDTMEFVFADEHPISGEPFMVTWLSLVRNDIHFRLKYSFDQQRWTTIADDIPILGFDGQGRAMGQSSWNVPQVTRNRKCWLKVFVFNESNARIEVYQKQCFIRVTVPYLIKCTFSPDGETWRKMLSSDYSSTTIDPDGNRRFTWQADLVYPRCIAKGYIKITIKDESDTNMGDDSTVGENKTTIYTDWEPSVAGNWGGTFTSTGVGIFNMTGTIYSYDYFEFSYQIQGATAIVKGYFDEASCLSMDSYGRVPFTGHGTGYAPSGYVWRNGQKTMWVELDGYSKHPHFDSLRGTWEAGDGQHGSFSMSKR